MSNSQDPLSFIECFRIWAWQACYYAEARFYLGPKYYCPTCTLKEKEIENGCPACPLTDKFSYYKENTISQIERRGGFTEGVTLAKLLQVYSLVSGILSENQNQIDKDWPLSFAELARVILQERSQYEFEKNFEQHQKLKALSK